MNKSLTLLSGVAAFVLASCATAHAMQPNFVVIMTDDQTADMLWGTHRSATAGALGNLIKQGTTFTNSFVVTPLCGPSRATFLTGQYSHNHHVLDNWSPAYAALDDTQTLATWLHGSGYRTGFVGKYVNGYGTVSKHGAPATTEIPPGWDSFVAFSPVPAYYNYVMNNNGTLETHAATPADYSTTVIQNDAVTFLSSQTVAKPFLMWVAVKAPHAPYTAATGDVGAYGTVAMEPRVPGYNEANVADKPAYIRALPLLPTVPGAVGFIDQMWRSQMESLLAVSDLIDAVVAELRNNGTYANTYIIFTSDNGYLHGEHRDPYEKMTPYEPSIRVPLVIVGPGVLVEKTRTEMVANLDLAPTILDLAGVTPTLMLDGKSMVPLLTSDAPLPTFRQNLLIEYLQASLTLAYPVAGGPNYTVPVYTGIRSTVTKYVSIPSSSDTELYDLVNDPYEVEGQQANPAFAATLAAMQETLAAMQVCRGASCQWSLTKRSLGGPPR